MAMTPEQIMMAQAHAKKDDAVFKFFKEVMDDVSSVFQTNEHGRSYVAERAQTVVAFTFADVVASYWYEYQGSTGTPRERFTSWINQYVFTPSNEEYEGSVFEELSPDLLYALRSSMVHFFGVAGDPKGIINIGITSISVPPDEIERWRAGFEAAGKKAVMFTPKQLYNLLLEGAVLMLDEWKEIIDLSQTDDQHKLAHIQGIDRIYQKIMLEGAAIVKKH